MKCRGFSLLSTAIVPETSEVVPCILVVGMNSRTIQV